MCSPSWGRASKQASQLAWLGGGLCFVVSALEGLGLLDIIPPEHLVQASCAL